MCSQGKCKDSLDLLCALRNEGDLNKMDDFKEKKRVAHITWGNFYLDL